MNRRNKMLAQRDVLRAKNQDLLKQIADIEAEMLAPGTDQATRLTYSPMLVDLYDEHYALTAEIAELIEAIPYPRKTRARLINAYYSRYLIAEILAMFRRRFKK